MADFCRLLKLIKYRNLNNEETSTGLSMISNVSKKTFLRTPMHPTPVMMNLYDGHCSRQSHNKINLRAWIDVWYLNFKCQEKKLINI